MKWLGIAVRLVTALVDAWQERRRRKAEQKRRLKEDVARVRAKLEAADKELKE